MTQVLLGYMGSGKSTVGRLLAEKQSLHFIDFDDYIENKEGLSVPEIFKQKGEIYFRKKEAEYLQQLLAEKPKAVVSLGGGTPCFGNNMQDVLKATEHVFYLKLSVDALVKRLTLEKEQRPLIKEIGDDELSDFIRKHLFERNFFYLQAPHIINVENETPEELVEIILKKLV
ncbi:shikimate kinase [Galbibacter mesophilus]|uniref:shikimate kinase n=1 Tax=Galbibacter mesophilus TaxID=379069 RepID=UPI00191EFE4F|nr:shikimate kinase [Galbibacter mesophilus]MCM5661559.1 AAA family ATPase [Galbibacter mesophilus]